MSPILAMLFAGCLSAHCKHPVLVPRGFPLATFVSTLTMGSGTASVTATNPDSGPFTVSGSISWLVLVNLGGYSWTLNVQSASSTFASCAQVPISAVKVTCTSITDGSLIGGASKTCAAASNLATASHLLASGTDPTIIVPFTRTVNFQYTFTDAWQYPATGSACTVSVNYFLNAV